MKRKFSLAIRLLEKHPDKNSSDGTFQLCAVLFGGSRVINFGFNDGKSHPLGQATIDKYNITSRYAGRSTHHKNCSIHAEMKAMMSNSDKGDMIVVVRKTQNSRQLTCAKPCLICQALMKERGIKKVIYSDWNGEYQQMNLKYE